MKIAFLACRDTLPGSETRRPDAFEHDLQFDNLAKALETDGHTLEAVDWKSGAIGFDAAVIGTTWDYQDDADEFVAALESMSTTLPIFNTPELVRWNIDKSYLKELGDAGAPIIPTLWRRAPGPDDIADAFDLFKTDKLVVKRQVGAGAEGQSILMRGGPDVAGFAMDRPAMIQPFLPGIVTDGEYSFIFIGGEFCHALVKRPRDGDYRVQSAYGGTETPIRPAPQDQEAAEAVLSKLPDPSPLYARIDMARGDDGGLLLMEAELVEPYLYPVQGPHVGKRMAKALLARL